ncbi:MAG: AAA family ATPase [Planctomycetaceae bacterium]
MKIRQIEVDRFGPWRNLRLPFEGHPFEMIYGPNEAGKSSLMRFIRGVLYGYDSHALEGPRGDFGEDVRRGALLVEHRGVEYRISREGEWNERGTLHVDRLSSSGERREEQPDAILRSITGGTDELLFQNAFAVGLDEVQHLASLHEEEVGQHIYGLTLGPAGRQILKANTEAERHQQQLFQPAVKQGELFSLMAEEDRLQKEIVQATTNSGVYLEKKKQLSNLQDEIEALRKRQQYLQQEQRGCRFMELIYKPWRQVYDYEQELKRLPVRRNLPVGGLEKLRRLESDINQARHSYRDRRGYYRNSLKQSSGMKPDSNVRRQANLMQTLLDQRGWYQDERGEIDRAEEKLRSARHDLNHQLNQLQALWPGVSLERCRQIRMTSGSNRELLAAARKYQRELAKRSRFRKRYDNLVRRNQTRTAELTQVRLDLNGLSITEALSRARQQLSNIKRRLELQLQIKAFQERMERSQAQLARQEERIGLPTLAYLAITIFVLGGLLAVGFGLWMARQQSWLPGAIYFFLGLTSAGIGWSIKSHFRNVVSETVRETQDDLFETRAKLNQLQREVDRLYDPRLSDLGDAPDTESLIDRAYQKVRELEGHQELEQRVQAERERLSRWRNRSQDLQRKVSEIRQQWCQLLQRIGLPESVKTEETFALWEHVQSTVAADAQLRQLEEALGNRRHALDHFESQVLRVNDDLATDGETIQNRSSLHSVFPQWEDLLGQYGEWRSVRRKNRTATRDTRREVRRLQKEYESLRSERSELLKKAGVHSFEEYAELEEKLKRRQELEELLALAQADLDRLARTEPELAIVEEDLEQFDPAANQSRLYDLSSEEKNIAAKLARSLEESGALKQQLSHWESDQSLMRFRQELAIVRAKLHEATSRWFGLQVSQEISGHIQSRYERTQQPEVLATASRYFTDLTEGKYQNVWTPLGKRHLCLEDNQQRLFRVEQVSRGTRELLFLSIRMALVQQFASKEVELPFILDDVMVNFDQGRTETTLNTLLKWAETGQQILCFTCHLHLAKMLEDRGVKTFHLPKHQATAEAGNRWAG